MDELTKDVNDHAGAESGLNAGLGFSLRQIIVGNHGWKS